MTMRKWWAASWVGYALQLTVMATVYTVVVWPNPRWDDLVLPVIVVVLAELLTRTSIPLLRNKMPGQLRGPILAVSSVLAAIVIF